MWPARDGRMEVVRELLKHPNIDVTLKDKVRCIYFHYDMYYNFCIESVLFIKQNFVF